MGRHVIVDTRLHPDLSPPARVFRLVNTEKELMYLRELMRSSLPRWVKYPAFSHSQFLNQIFETVFDNVK
eukprot:1183917-Prorocentrum_minimum.AAC.1